MHGLSYGRYCSVVTDMIINMANKTAIDVVIQLIDMVINIAILLVA